MDIPLYFMKIGAWQPLMFLFSGTSNQTVTRDEDLSKKLPYKGKCDHKIPESKHLKPGLIQLSLS